ncbi:MAG TPA: ABC transporter substrate-binding protein [Thermomicrobiales bacterium]|nr:ABC transporter substrate-binding protein [Thermomicrobiales bacterium]
MTTTRINRRSMVKGAAGVAASAAIGSKASSVFAAPAVIQSGPIEVTYWTSFQGGANGEAQDEVVRRFNESQSDIRVNHEFQGSYEETAQALTAAVQGGSAPDMSLLSDVWWFKFYLSQLLQPLDDYIAAENVDTQDYVDSLWNEGVRQGVQYWIPFARSTPLFYYNAEVLEEAGLDPSIFQNWDTIVENTEALMARDGDQVSRYAFGHPNAASYIAWLFQGVIWQFNGEYSQPDFTITIDEPAGIEAGNFYRDSVADGWAGASAEHDVDFATGLYASVMASTGSMGNIRNTANFEWGTAFLPEKYTFGCCTGGSGLSVMASADDANKEAAFEFIKFSTSPEITAYWAQQTGYMPVRKSAVESEEMQAFYEENPHARTAVEQLPLTEPQDAARVFIPNGDQIIGGGLERITVNTEDAGEVFPDVAQTLEEEAEPVVQQLESVEPEG